MADIMTPALGESVTEATVARWTKAAGEAVRKDELVVELETDKVSLEVVAPADGVLQIEAEEGATVTPGTRLGAVTEAGAAEAAPKPAAKGRAAAKAAPSASAAPPADAPTATAAAPAGEAEPDSAGAATAAAAVPDMSAPDQAAPAEPPPAGGGSQAGVDVTVPAMGESVTEGTLGAWSKKVGDAVAKDEILVEIETDKVAVEVNAPADGVLSEVLAEDGASVTPNQVIARIASAGAAASPAVQQPSGAGQYTPANQPPAAQKGEAPAAAPQPAMPLSPSVQRIATENRLDTGAISGSGKDGRITKGDALAAVDQRGAPASAPAQAAPQAAPRAAPTPTSAPPPMQVAGPRPVAEREERVRMSRLRQTIARRLKDAQNTAAMLTTFNEVDMTAVMALRNQYKDAFEKRHGVKLGFMSVFVRACIAALKEVPAVNAEIDGNDLIYKNHYDIGVAVGTEKGLVVPVVRDADALTLAGIEKAIGALGKKARDGQLSIEDMQGGTFTISNGGVYGSLMSTPILNAPQSGILGMHKIQERPMAVGGKVEIRPMMYLALSYDHRVVDGKEAVTFLVSVKDHVEDPQRLILDL